MNDFTLLVPWFSLCVTISLLHLLWLGTLIAGCAAFANRYLVRHSANSRYLLQFASLVAMFLCVPATLAVVATTTPRSDAALAANQDSPITELIVAYPGPPDRSFVIESESMVEPPRSSVNSHKLEPEVSITPPNQTDAWSPISRSKWIAGGYLFGVVVMLVRLLLGLSGGRMLSRSASPVAEGNIRQIVERQARALGLKAIPVVAYCEQVAVPAVVGILRPVILLPISMIAGVTSEQLAHVLTHELAHVRRFDHVAIVLQRMLETVWFFHPAAWWVSRRLNRERENCCDDLVVAAGVQRISYAESLCRVAELTAAHRSNFFGPVIVAVDGHRRSHLHERIARLLEGPPAPSIRLTRTGMFGVAATLTLLGLPAVLLPIVNDRAGTQLAADEIQSEAPSSLPSTEAAPLKAGPPDYTKITGYVENPSLPIKEPKVLWKFKSETKNASDGASSMISLTDSVVGDGVVYFADGGAPGRVYALNAHDGSELWRREHSSAGITNPSIDQDHVYFGSKTGVTALHRDTGAVAWNHPIRHGAGECVPIPVGDRIYVSGYDGLAYALNQADGSVVWKHDFGVDAPSDQPGFEGARARFQEIVARPRGSACDGELFIQGVFDQSRLLAVDCATGQRRWSFQANGWIGPDPTIVDDRVYIGSQDKHLYCLDRNTGRVVWKFAAPTWIASRVAVHKGQVFLPVHGGKLLQIDAESGQLIQTFTPEKQGDRHDLTYTFPVITDRFAYYASGDGQFYAVDIATCQQQWRIRPSEGSQLYSDPTTDGQRLFVTCRQDGDKAGECALIALGTEPASSSAGSSQDSRVKPPRGAESPREAKSIATPSSSKTAPTDSSKDANASADGTNEGEYTFPIRVEGRAIDEHSDAIEGARLFLAAGEPGYRRLAETVSDSNGYYRFDKILLPIQRADTNRGRDVGTFEVFGTAKNRALTWRPRKTFFPDTPHEEEPNRDDPERHDVPTRYGRDDHIRLDLIFGPSKSIRGRVVDDAGQPIPETKLAIRYCDTEWHQEDYSLSGFQGSLNSLNEREIVPLNVKTRTTDADGRFEFTDLPADHRWGIDVRPPGHPPRRIWAVTRTGIDSDANGARVYSGDFEVTFSRPRKVRLRVVYGDTEQPAPKVGVGGTVTAAGFWETTDEQGVVETLLPDGEYQLGMFPRVGTPYLKTMADLVVSAETTQRVKTLRLRPAAIVDITVVDADTGNPLPNVDVWLDRRVHGYRSWEVETRISHYESPRSDKDGRMRVLFEPGKHRIGVGKEAFPEGYEPVDPDGKEIDCQPGEPAVVTYRMRRKN